MSEHLTTIGQSFLLVVAALFPIINPPGTALIFLSMTRRSSHEERAQLAKLIALYAGLIVLASLSFGISVPILRVAGGIVVALMAWQMLSAPAEDDQPAARPIKTTSPSVAFYPLTMPLTTGRGTIAICIALGTSRSTDGQVLGIHLIGALGAVLAIVALIYICFAYADRVERALGRVGSEAFARLFAFILLCIGIQTLWTGLYELWETLPAK